MAKRKKAIENLRKLEQAQHKLIAEMNKLIQQAKKEGYTTKVSPQALRLAGLREYRTRDFAKINSLLDSPELLQNNVAVIDADSGEIIRGGEALERYDRYQRSGIYHANTPLVNIAMFGEEIPSEAERTLTNFVEETEKAFLDDNVYHEFMNTLDKLMNGDTSVADDSMWQMLHPGIFITNGGKTRSASSIQHSKEHFMRDIDKYNVHDIQSAVNRLIAADGVESVVRRLHDAGENIIDALIVAGIGYQEQAGSAVQAVLTVLLPDETRQRAMAMGDLPDMVDDFNIEERE